MSNSLRDRLGALATSFAGSVLDVIRGYSLEQLLDAAEAGGRTRAARRGESGAPSDGRLARRSKVDVAHAVERIVDLLERHDEGLRAEEIRRELGLEAKDLARPLKEALASGRLSKSGRKRATTYFAKSSRARTAAGPSAAKRAGGGAKSKSGGGVAGRRRGRRTSAAANAGRRQRGKGRASGAPSRKSGPRRAPSVQASEHGSGEAKPAAAGETPSE